MRIETKNQLGLFPLGIIVLPGEQTTLHIFEPRYKQLINDCFASNADFGIPFYHQNKTQSIGTRVKLVDIERFYKDGRMDIRIEGVSLIRIESFQPMMDAKLYPGGEVTEVQEATGDSKDSELLSLFQTYVQHVLNEKKYDYHPTIQIYDIANTLNLSKDEKYKLIKTSLMTRKQQVLKNHLKLVLNLFEQEQALDHKFFLN